MAGRHRGFTLIELIIVMVIIAIIAALAIPGLLASQRASNERGASASMKSIAVAESDFKINDRDANLLSDYWTADVKGLYSMTSCAVPGNAGGTTDPPLRLIELALATADSDGALATAGGECMDVTQFGVVSSKAGYWYAALDTDGSATGSESTYKQDTGGTYLMGNVHNATRFGFICFPDSQTFGKHCYILNEYNVIYRSPLTSNIRMGASTPPGAAGVGFQAAYATWPNDSTMKSIWSKLD